MYRFSITKFSRLSKNRPYHSDVVFFYVNAQKTFSNEKKHKKEMNVIKNELFRVSPILFAIKNAR